MNFEKVWDKIVFIASIVGLIFLIFISLFRYFILMPSLEKVTNKDEYKPAIKIKKYYK